MFPAPAKVGKGLLGTNLYPDVGGSAQFCTSLLVSVNRQQKGEEAGTPMWHVGLSEMERSSGRLFTEF